MQKLYICKNKEYVLVYCHPCIDGVYCTEDQENLQKLEDSEDCSDKTKPIIYGQKYIIDLSQHCIASQKTSNYFLSESCNILYEFDRKLRITNLHIAFTQTENNEEIFSRSFGKMAHIIDISRKWIKERIIRYIDGCDHFNQFMTTLNYSLNAAKVSLNQSTIEMSVDDAGEIKASLDSGLNAYLSKIRTCELLNDLVMKSKKASSNINGLFLSNQLSYSVALTMFPIILDEIVNDVDGWYFTCVKFFLSIPFDVYKHKRIGSESELYSRLKIPYNQTINHIIFLNVIENGFIIFELVVNGKL